MVAKAAGSLREELKSNKSAQIKISSIIDLFDREIQKQHREFTKICSELIE